jgi:hypothetical protein
MRHALLSSLLFASLGFSQTLLRSEGASPVGDEAKKLDFIKRDKTTKRVKVMTLDEHALAGSAFEVELFDGNRKAFSLVRREQSSDRIMWKGRSNESGNLDRFSIARTSGIYAGYAFIGGNMYVIRSLKGDKIALIEQDLGFECGTHAHDNGE